MKLRATIILLIGLGLTVMAGCDKGDDPAASNDPPAKSAEPAGKGPASAPAGKGPASAPAGKGPASAPAGKADGKAKAFFAFPQDGSKIYATSTVAFGVEGMTVTPAGQELESKTHGPPPLVIDGEPIEAGKPVPADEKHIHFGKGQTETEVKLEPGKHTLTMQFADGSHLSYGPAMSSTITVEVVPDPPAKKVAFVEPADGAKVKSPLKVKFGVEGMTVTPAGQELKDKTHGHHHLIIDGKPIPTGQAVPADETHIHYGKGQTEAEIELKPGKHTLTMQFADGSHLSYGPTMSSTITVEVE